MATDTQIRRLWWNQPKGSAVAQALTAEATYIETNSMPRRWRSYVYFRTMSGRPVCNQLAFSMARRPTNFQNYYGGYEFAPVRAGFSGMLGDIYVNRVLIHKTYLNFIPERGDFTQRQTGLDIEDWTEGMFEGLKFWDEYKQMGLNALWYGTGFLKFYIEAGGLKVKSIHPDELLFSNEDEKNPTSVIQRVWASREDTMALYGKDEASKKAISNAESFAAFYFGPGQLQTEDVIPILEAWRVKRVDGSPGRHVLVVGDHCIQDEEFLDAELPFEKFPFHEIPDSVYGQGLAELTLQYSEWIDEIWNVMYESDARSGLGKWLVEENSNVNDQALGDTNAGVVKYAGKEPKYVAHEPLGQWSNQRLQMLIDMGSRRVHVSQNAIAGEVPKALTSAPALEKWSNIDDSNFGEMIGRLEEVVKRSGYQLIRLAKKVKPSFTRPGRTKEIIDWDALKIKDGQPLDLTAFNVGRLGQTVAGRVQALKDMLGAGDIDRRLYNKYLQVPDNSQLLDELNAPTESVSKCLDQLVLKDKYRPPSPYMDLDFAKQSVEARILLEEDMGTPEKVLDRLRMWRAAAVELLAQRNTPPAPPAGAPANDNASAPVTGLQLPAAAPNVPVGTSAGIPGAPIPIPATAAA